MTTQMTFRNFRANSRSAEGFPYADRGAPGALTPPCGTGTMTKMPLLYPPAARSSRRVALLLVATAGFVVLAGAGCGRDEPIVSKEGPRTCSPEGGGPVPLADTGYTMSLPSGWCLYEWTKDDPVFQQYPYNGKPHPFLLQSTHGIQNRSWAVEYPTGSDIGVACTVYYFLAPVDDAYLDWERRTPNDSIGPLANLEYARKYQVYSYRYYRERSFGGRTYYDHFAYRASRDDCTTVYSSISVAPAVEPSGGDPWGDP